MKTKGYLIIGKNGSIRAVKNPRTGIGPDEIAIALNIEIPDKAF